MKYSTLVISLIILMLVATAGVFVWQALQPVVPDDGTTPTLTDDGENTTGVWKAIDTRCEANQCKGIEEELKKFSDLEIVDSSAWQVYKNNQQGFSIRYPIDWTLIDKNNTQYGEFTNNGTILLVSPDTLDLYFQNPPEGMTERYIDLLVSIDEHEKAKNEYEGYIRDGVSDKALITFISTNGMKGFLYNNIEGSMVVSIPRNEMFSVNFTLQPFDERGDQKSLPLIKTIINSLEFQG